MLCRTSVKAASAEATVIGDGENVDGEEIGRRGTWTGRKVNGEEGDGEEEDSEEGRRRGK